MDALSMHGETTKLESAQMFREGLNHVEQEQEQEGASAFMQPDQQAEHMKLSYEDLNYLDEGGLLQAKEDIKRDAFKELNHMDEEESDLLPSDQPAENMKIEALNHMNEGDTDSLKESNHMQEEEESDLLRSDQLAENMRMEALNHMNEGDTLKESNHMEGETADLMHSDQPACDIKMENEALKELNQMEDEGSGLMHPDQFDNMKAEAEGLNDMNEGDMDLFPAKNKIKIEDEALTSVQDFSFDEDIKLEPEIFLSEQQEPMSAMSFLKQHVGNPTIHSCHQCEHVAVSRPSLMHHIRSVHLGIRYPCQQCDYMAKRKSQLNVHVQTIHEGKRYPCDQCEYVANQRGMLLVHIKSKHEGKGIYFLL